MGFYRIYFIWLLFLEYQYANTAVLISGGSLDQCLINEMCYFIYVCGAWQDAVISWCGHYIMLTLTYYISSVMKPIHVLYHLVPRMK